MDDLGLDAGDAALPPDAFAVLLKMREYMRGLMAVGETPEGCLVLIAVVHTETGVGTTANNLVDKESVLELIDAIREREAARLAQAAQCNGLHRVPG